jgi:outer membrane receptor for ferrienterochelin and colicin
MQFNYSRKIGRPGFFQILPFVDFSDSLNLSVGNPALMPEFTHLTEISYLNQYSPGHSFNSTLYAKLTDNLITRYQYKGANTNPAAKPDTVIYNSFGNADYSYTIGIELTSRNKIVKIWDITSNINLFDVTLKNIAGNADKHQFSWFAKLANNFLLPKSYSIQLYADYQARTILPVNSGRGSNGVVSTSPYGVTQNIAQGYIKPVYGADIAVKKDFLKNNVASVSVQFSDIFRTRTYETHASTGDFIQDNYRQRDPQFVRLNLNWRFGKSDITLLKRKNLKVENEGLQGL